MVTTPSIPFAAYVSQLFDGLQAALLAVLPFAAAMTALAIGVHLIFRWIGGKRADFSDIGSGITYNLDGSFYRQDADLQLSREDRAHADSHNRRLRYEAAFASSFEGKGQRAPRDYGYAMDRAEERGYGLYRDESTGMKWTLRKYA